MRHTRSLLLVVLVAVIAVLAGCPRTTPAPTEPAAAPPAAPAPESVEVRVGYFPNVTHAPAVLGFSAAEQTFQKALEGRATLKATVFNAGPAAMEALHAGALDLCFVGPTPAVTAYARGGDTLTVCNVANGGTTLVARKGLTIDGVAGLEGKRISVPQIGNHQDLLLRYLLLREGIKLADAGGTTKVMPVENPDVKTLFVQGQLDAACVPEPWGARLEVETGATVVLDYKQIWRDGDYPVTVLVARKEFLEQHADLVEAFRVALEGLVTRLQTVSDADAAAVNAEIKVLTGKELAPEVVTKSFERMVFTTEVDAEVLAEIGKALHSVGYLDQEPDLSGMIAPRPAASATPAPSPEEAR